MMSAPPAAVHRRTWPQRILILFNVFLVVACIGAVSWYGWLYQRGQDIPRAAIAEGVLEPEVKDPGEPKNFLLVGSDSRQFTDGDADAINSFGDSAGVGGQRADTIMLLRVDPQTETVAMVSFPRDLVVDLPGGGQTRINNAFENGPEALIETVKLNFDVPVHHYAQVDFAGFEGLVDAIGGVNLFFPNPVRDWKYERGRGNFNPSGLDIPEAGCRTMSGSQALSYVRSRHFEELVDGEWESDPIAPDIQRIDRQQRFMIRAVNQAISDDFLNPVRLSKLLTVAEDHVVFDEQLSVGAILDLGEIFDDFTPDRLQRNVVQTVPIGEGSSYGGEQYVEGPINAATFSLFREQLQPGEAEPADVTLTVLNGSGRPGEATLAADQLTLAGFAVATRGDAPAPATQTTLLHAPGQTVAADLVARYLAAGAVLQEDAAVADSDVVLVTGANFIGLLDEPRPPAAAPPVAPPAAETTTTTTTVDPTTQTTLSAAEAERLWYAAVAEGQCQ